MRTRQSSSRRCRKRQFPDEIAAKFALAMNATHPGRYEQRREKRAYFCRSCRAWHLTSQEQRTQVAAADKRAA